MVKKQVYVTHGQGPFFNAKNALALLDLGGIKNKSVLVKPNLGRKVQPGRGVNTHPEAIRGVLEVLKDCGCARIAIGESPILGVNVKTVYKESGIEEIAAHYGCELIAMDDIPPVVKEIPGARVVEATKVCAPVLEYDCLLSVPVAKCHMHTGVSLSIKNMKGCLWRKEKVRYHQLEYADGKSYPEKTLDTAISDLATILLPDITLLDGYMGMEGLGPSGGDPIVGDFAVASLDPLGADMVGCAMMGINAQDVVHLRLTAERMGFSLQLEDYDITPADFRQHALNFKRPPTEIAIEYPDVQLYDIESCSACLSSVMFFLKKFKTDMSQYLQDDGKLHLAIGKGITCENVKKGTILVGNCARKAKESGVFVPGCPPVATQIYRGITGSDPEENE